MQMLARWLERAQLSNGQPCPLPQGGLTDLLAEAILNRLAGLVYDPTVPGGTGSNPGKWVPVDVSGIVDQADIHVETLDEHAIRITHEPTGLVALETTYDGAYAVLKRKVKEAARAE
ncbi:hypothetical protein [Gordonia sp. SND2]|uniref:hypothetical protein n=1 Tax=Gordonia sp. SND2 TaxID=3388659 RepID=UPI00398B9CC8